MINHSTVIKLKSNLLSYIVLLIFIILCSFFPASAFVMLLSIIFFIVALNSLHKALFLLLATHPITRDGLVITIGIIDFHLIYIFQLILITIWFLNRKAKPTSNQASEIKFFFRVIIISLLAAAISTIHGGISTAGIREIIKYSLDIITALIVYKIVSNDIEIGINILQKWIKIIAFFAVLSFLMSLVFVEPFPSYRIKYENFKEEIEYYQPQPFKYITFTELGVEEYNRLEIGFGAPYGSFPCVLMAALLIALGPMVVKNRKNYFLKSKLNVSIIIIFIALILTYTRSAWVGLIIGIISLFMFSKSKTKVLKLIMPVLIILVILKPSTLTQRLIQIDPESKEGSVVSHLRTFQTAEDAIYSNPILGVGYANLPSTGDMAAVARGRGVVHSAVLQLWAELGTVGLILFLFIPGYLFYIIKRNANKNTQQFPIVINIGIISSLIAIVFQSIFIPGLDVIFWILLGFSVAFNTQLLEASTTQKTVQTII